MTTIDWKALKPHIPLKPGDAQYVARDSSAGQEMAHWLRADSSPLLVGGPAGVGKSTELARAAELLKPDRLAFLIQLDRFENMRRLTPDRMRMRIAQAVGHFAKEVVHLPLSASLLDALKTVSEELQAPSVGRGVSPSVVLDMVLKETSRLSRQGRVTLLIDGLEKVPQGVDSLDLFDALAMLPETVELVVVIPWHAAFGPQAETVIRPGERFVAVRALDVEGDAGEEGREFLREVLLERLRFDKSGDHNPEDLAERIAGVGKIVTEASVLSGGLLRVFLQLVADAGSYAKLRRADPWPRSEDLADACADQTDSFRRLLLPGDVDAIGRAVGSNGTELDLERKIRLMAHGILLERLRDGARIVELSPLALNVLGKGWARA